MSRFIVRRKNSVSAEGTPLGDAMTRLSGPEYRPFASVKLEGANFTPLSEIQTASDTLKALTERKTLIVDGEQRAMQRLREETSQLYHVERLIEYSKTQAPFDMFRAGPSDLAQMLRSEPLDTRSVGRDRRLTIRVQGRGARQYEDLQHAQVHVFLSAPRNVRGRLQMQTDESGTVRFSIASWYSILAIVAYPYAYYAPAILRGDHGRRPRLLCERLPKRRRSAAAWWHEAVGSNTAVGDELGKTGNRRIKVGVVDSGCGPHPCLSHVRDIGSFIEGVHANNQGEGFDSGSHGTHVCGIIGARNGSIPFHGIAPGADLFSARVFAPGSNNANQGDIADALDALVAEGVELVNMSLGSVEASDILSDAIGAAFGEGTVCVCAAGNDSGPVSYPAAFSDTVAVSAIGKLGQVDASSLPALPVNPGLFGALGYYAAAFTNFGPEIGVAAPGVGIIAPVPSRFGLDQPYAIMNGTSMASPIVTGSVAGILARSRDYLSLNVGRDRSRFVHTVAAVASRSVELPPDYEGRGIPNISTEWVK